MQLRSGKTRIVIRTGNKAIKIGKFRPILLFFRAISFPFMSKGNHTRFYARYGSPFWLGAWNYFIAGIQSNIREFEYYQKFRDSRVIPTLGKYLGGWIIVQLRGEDVSQDELDLVNPFEGLPVNPDFLERNQPWQFCRVGDQILLADYGRAETCRALEQTLETTLVTSKVVSY